jgi:hypothetical protein
MVALLSIGGMIWEPEDVTCEVPPLNFNALCNCAKSGKALNAKRGSIKRAKVNFLLIDKLDLAAIKKILMVWSWF